MLKTLYTFKYKYYVLGNVLDATGNEMGKYLCFWELTF